MRCPMCDTKIPKKTGICPTCTFRVPPQPSLLERLLFLPIPMIIVMVLTIAGAGLLLYRYCIPSDYKEPDIGITKEYNINGNIGVVFFDNVKNEFKDQLTEDLNNFNITGQSKIYYKYNTDADCYAEAINDLLEKSKCKYIFITDKAYINNLTAIAKGHPKTQFFVLWDNTPYTTTGAKNIHICQVNVDKAIYAQGYTSGQMLTEITSQVDTAEAIEIGQANYAAVFLYTNDSTYDLYEQFITGVKQCNMTLSTYAVKVTDTEAYINELAATNNTYALFAADEMPSLIKALKKVKTDNIYLSGTGSYIADYNNYISTVIYDYSSYIDFVFTNLSEKESIPIVYEGEYSDGFTKLKYNSDNLPVSTQSKIGKLLK